MAIFTGRELFAAGVPQGKIKNYVGRDFESLEVILEDIKNGANSAQRVEAKKVYTCMVREIRQKS